MAEQRVKTLRNQLKTENSSFPLPLPPIAELKEGQLFPTYPQVLEDSRKFGGIFTYVLKNNRRITFITDQNAYRHVFYARDNKDVVLDSAKLAYHWFGIQKELARDYTRPALDKVREAMSYGKMLKLNEKVGQYALRKMSELDSKGESDLWNIAMLTFVPVVQNLFGEETFSDVSQCPHIAQTLWDYDADFKKVANGMPRKWFPNMETLGAELDSYFEKSIEKGLHNRADAGINCPVIKARLSVIPDGKYTSAERARFIFSVFWASQGNTIPGTFWLLALISSNELVKRKLMKELKERYERLQPGEPEFFNFEDCEYLQACVKEALRLKVANVTLRNVVNEVEVSLTDGKHYRVPKGDEITVSSYVQHHDDRIYDNPEDFLPERWLGESGKKVKDFDWFPFGAGTNKCSGRHLAQLELGTIAGLFFTQFDVELLEEVPREEWENCVAMVAPIKRSLKFRYKRIV